MLSTRYFIYSSRLPVKRVPSLSSPADEQTETQRNEGHRHLEVTEPRCKLRAVPPQAGGKPVVGSLEEPLPSRSSHLRLQVPGEGGTRHNHRGSAGKTMPKEKQTCEGRLPPCTDRREELARGWETRAGLSRPPQGTSAPDTRMSVGQRPFLVSGREAVSRGEFRNKTWTGQRGISSALRN